MRIFINNVDSYVGKALCADLRSVLGQENKIFGTLQAEGGEKSAELVKELGLKRLVSKADQTKYLEDVLSCSLIVFDLHSSTADEVEAIIKHIKLAKLSHETTFVLISSVNVWAKTLRPDQLAGYELAKSGDDEEAEEEENQENKAALEAELKLATAVLPNGDLRLPNGDTGKFKEPKRPRVLTDQDRDRRVPAPEYENWKYLETLALSLGPKEKLRPHVLCAGILYGNGETTFNELFKAAWLTQPTHVVTKNQRGNELEPGTNYVPCVHVRDVARLVRVVAADKSVGSYLIAVDRARLPQKAIIQGIVGQISNVKEIPIVEPAQMRPGLHDVMTYVNDERVLDLIMEPSAPMRSSDFDWWCKKGLVENIAKVAEEFCRWRNLRPIKTVVLGPPGSGMEQLGAKIAGQYLHQDPPRFTFEDILADELKAGNETKLKAKVDQVKAVPGKKLKLKTRTRLVKRRLMSNVCRYRGYVLEGYPSSFEEAMALFTQKAIDPENDDPPPDEEEEESDVPEEEDPAEAVPPPGDEEEENPEEEEKREVDKAICPEYVVVISSDEAKCKERIFEARARFSGDEAAFVMQTQEYRNANLQEDGSAGAPEFFEEEASVKVLKADVDVQSEEDLFHAARVYIESKGNFFNYLRSEEDIVKEKLQKIAAKEQAEKEAAELKKKADEALEESMRNERASQEAAQRNVIQEAEASLLESQALPLRTYLMNYVVPTLSDGMLDVCKEMPEDPIEHLAQYLFAHAQDIEPQLEAAMRR